LLYALRTFEDSEINVFKEALKLRTIMR
jgi:hypothetical protein